MNHEDLTHEEIIKLESKLKLVRKKGDLPVESRLCNLLGRKYEAIADWREALKFHYFDLEIGQAMSDWEGQMLAISNMASIYHR